MVEKKFYFICGLPRSGSTLLNGILNQNPSIHGSMSTSLCSLYRGILTSRIPDIINTTEQQAFNLYKSTAEAYYKDIEKPIIFDTYRRWPIHIGLMPRLFPYTKFIFCMRDIPSILNSFEYFYLNKNKLPATVKDNHHCLLNPYLRLQDYYDSLIAYEYDAANYIYYSPTLREHCIFLDYDRLIYDTDSVINWLYEELNLPKFKHDFENINHCFEDIDEQYSNENLHKVYNKVGKTPTKWILPQHVVEQYNRNCFWRE